MARVRQTVPCRDMALSSSLSYPLFGIPASVYAAVQRLRESAYRLGVLNPVRAPMPVISIGNIVMGGSGKTPFTMYLAELLREHGFKPAIISRGYRGAYQEGYLVVAGDGSTAPTVSPDQCGDEPFLMASRLPGIPVIVARKRILGVLASKRLFQCNVALLDDGFQHLPLYRTLDIVLISGAEDHMFPLGNLREPISALRRASVAVSTSGNSEVPQKVRPFLHQVPLFRCTQRIVGLAAGPSCPAVPPSLFSGKDVVLVSAIAYPGRFRSAADSLGWHVIRHFMFRDHHRLSDSELDQVMTAARDLPIVVTEKDWVKLPPWFTERDQVRALRIGIQLEDERAFEDLILAGIAA